MAYFNAIAENCEVRRRWAAFQLSQDEEKAMKEWFKAEKQTQRKKKLEKGKTKAKDPQAVKHSPKVCMDAGPTHNAKVEDHAEPPPVLEVVKPSNVVCALEGENALSLAVVAPAGHPSTAHVASSIKFSRHVEFGLSALKEGDPNGESAVMLKLRKELEDLKMKLTTEKSNRMVAEQLLSIVQQDLAEQQLRVSKETTARVKLENELVFVKTDLKQTQRELQTKEDSIEELRLELKMANSVVERMEEYSQAVKYSTGGIDHFLDMKLSAGRVSEAEKKLKVCQQELLHSQEEVQRLLDKMEDLTQERGEMVSHRVHSRLLKIADERADEAEKRVHELEAEVDLLRVQVERAKQEGTSEEAKPLSLFSSSLAVSHPLFSSPYSSSALLTISAPHSSVPSLDSFKFVSPYQTDEFEPSTIKASSEVARPSVAPQTAGLQGVGRDWLSAHSTSLSATPVDLGQGVKGDQIGQRETGPAGDRLGVTEAGVEDEVGMEVVREGGSRDSDDTGGVLLPFAELPDLDLLGDEGGKLVDESGMRKEKKSTVSILRVIGDSDGPDDDDNDSSDWGSSSEDGDVGEEGGTPVALPQFGVHEDGASEHPMPERKRPPPLLPKPVHLQFWQANADMIYYETPSSFEKPPSQPGLRRFPFFPKPLGPRGRRLPARYQSLQQALELPVVA